MKLKHLPGFSLIELMIVIAIIGILASIAVPAYQNYIFRARTAELISMGEGAKTAINDYMQEQGQTAPSCTDKSFASAFTPPPSPVTQNVQSVAVEPSSCSVQIAPNANVGFKGVTNPPFIVLKPTITPDGSITWTCNSFQGDFKGTQGSKYAPSTCQ